MWTESEPMTRDFYNKNLGILYGGWVAWLGAGLLGPQLAPWLARDGAHEVLAAAM
jgi:hypothetical protein